MKKIYLDNAATTKIDGDILRVINKCYKKTGWANASSIHSFGRECSNILQECRDKISSLINCNSNDIIFTSGSTEGNNIVLQNCLNDNKKNVLISSIEHPSVMNVASAIQKNGILVQKVNVDTNGIIDLDDLRGKINEETILVSVMLVNNEVGSIQPVKEIADICHENGCMLHIDATQAVNHIKIDVKKFDCDFLTVSAHKFYGPKGVGFLYVKNKDKADMRGVYFGGEQEGGIRPGTYNVPNVLGMTKAFQKAQSKESIENETKRCLLLAEYFWIKLVTKVGGVKLNGPGIRLSTQRVPSIINISFNGIGAETIFTMLDIDGIAVGSGSACSGSAIMPSYVLMAMGRSEDKAGEGVRFSFGKHTTYGEIDKTISCLRKIVKSVRNYK